MYTDHIVNAINNHELVHDSTLHVVGVVSNSMRYHSRYRIFREWVAAMQAAPNVQLHIVELAFGDRHHEVSLPKQVNELQLRSSNEIWHKENMINLGVRHLLPRDWRYMAWVDADVWFGNANWALETMHELQRYPIVQPWSECTDMGPWGNIVQMFRSFTSLVVKGVKQQINHKDPYPYGHSGFAWACTRAFWENIEGLMDFPILGSADHHQAWALLNKVDYTVHGGMTDSFRRACHAWQHRAFQMTHGHVGYVPGRIEHKFHGPKGRRNYRERWDILVRSKFDPYADLRRDSQGLYYVYGKPQLNEDIREYFRVRLEDSIEEY